MPKAKTYQITPSGRLYLDGVEIPQDDRTPAYRAYVTWLGKDNGPTEIAEIDEGAEAGEEIDEQQAIEAELTKLEARLARLRESNTKETP